MMPTGGVAAVGPLLGGVTDSTPKNPVPNGGKICGVIAEFEPGPNRDSTRRTASYHGSRHSPTPLSARTCSAFELSTVRQPPPWILRAARNLQPREKQHGLFQPARSLTSPACSRPFRLRRPT